MATLEDKLEYLNETKRLIKQAIIDKGGSVADGDTFRSYADKISNLSVGGGGLDSETIAKLIKATEPDWGKMTSKLATSDKDESGKGLPTGTYTFTQDCYFSPKEIPHSSNEEIILTLNGKRIYYYKLTSNNSSFFPQIPFYRVSSGDVLTWNTPSCKGAINLNIVPLKGYVA